MQYVFTIKLIGFHEPIHLLYNKYFNYFLIICGCIMQLMMDIEIPSIMKKNIKIQCF